MQKNVKLGRNSTKGKQIARKQLLNSISQQGNQI